jgi:gamma-glutamyltranspeptidase / glutathione hydrolase
MPKRRNRSSRSGIKSKWHRCKKVLRRLAISFAVLVAIVLLDMAIYGSFYHPLTYLYNIASWLQCSNSVVPSCQKTTTPATAVWGKNGMVVTPQREASKVGQQILAEGGNAIDAAVAVGYALAVTDPCCGNLGGGGFMTIHLADNRDTFINFRERSPLAATKDMFLDSSGRVRRDLSTKGYLAVAVPGTVKGLDLALSEYGTMSRAQVMKKAIALAESGFIVQPGDVRILERGTKQFQSQPNVAAMFLKNGKTPYQNGDRLVQPDLARTLKLIADRGQEAFYRGQIATEIVRASQTQGGILAVEDFAEYTTKEEPPLHCTYRGYEVISAPPPGGGATLCQMLKILEGDRLQKLGWHSAKSLHFMLSAMLYAYSDRNKYLGDPDFVNNPVDRLLSPEYVAFVRSQIPDNRAIPPEPLYSGITSSEGTNTTHYSIVDRDGNAVAVTYTINSYFGAGIIAGNTGFFLNNEMDDFTAKPGAANNFGLVQGSANQIAPGKRPLSSMSPTIVLKDGKVFLVAGSPGGSTIPTTMLQAIVNLVDYGMKIEEAVNAPRFHYQGLPNLVITEPYALDSTTVQKLWDMGYRVAPLFGWGAAESIWVDPQTRRLFGVNDPRKPAGRAVAY